jgi:hypothetical protein
LAPSGIGEAQACGDGHEALDGYFENFKRFGHLDQVEVVIMRTVRCLLQPSSAREV